MQHPLNDRAVASGRFPPDSPARYVVLRFDERDQFLPQVLAERIDAQEHLAGPGVSDDPIRRGIPLGRIVSGRQVDRDIALRRVSQGIASEHVRIECLDDDLSSRHYEPAEGSRAEGIKSTARPAAGFADSMLDMKDEC